MRLDSAGKPKVTDMKAGKMVEEFVSENRRLLHTVHLFRSVFPSGCSPQRSLCLVTPLLWV